MNKYFPWEQSGYYRQKRVRVNYYCFVVMENRLLPYMIGNRDGHDQNIDPNGEVWGGCNTPNEAKIDKGIRPKHSQSVIYVNNWHLRGHGANKLKKTQKGGGERSYLGYYTGYKLIQSLANWYGDAGGWYYALLSLMVVCIRWLCSTSDVIMIS